MKPLQPIYTDEYGVVRFKGNFIVEYLLEYGGLNLNKLAVAITNPDHREDWEQFAQLIGYSLSGFSELNYVSDDCVAVAERMRADNLSQCDAELVHYRETLRDLRDKLREPIAELYGVHPDNLRGYGG